MNRVIPKTAKCCFIFLGLTLVHCQAIGSTGVVLAREKMLDGKRAEALQILNDTYQHERSTRVLQMIENFSTQFLDQRAEYSYFQALPLIAERKWAEAKGPLEAAHTEDAAQIWVLFRLGQVEFALGRTDSAQKYFASIIRLNPHFTDARTWLGALQLLTSKTPAEEKDAIRMGDLKHPGVFEKPVIASMVLEAFFTKGKLSDIEPLVRRFRDRTKRDPFVALMGLKFLGPNEELEAFWKDVAQACIKDEKSCEKKAEPKGSAFQMLWWLPENPIDSLKDLLQKRGRAR